METKSNNTMDNVISDEMTIYFNVFDVFVENIIMCCLDNIAIVTMNDCCAIMMHSRLSVNIFVGFSST